MKRVEILHAHKARMDRQFDRLALNDDASKVAPIIAAIAKRYGCSPVTVARIAVAHVSAA